MKYNSIGQQLVAKAKEIDPSYKPDKFNDMSEAIDIILNNSGGGKSVPPTLNLVDFENGGVRTTITEEEYNNLMNGLYNQVLYDTEAALISVYSPSKLFNIGGEYGFTQFKMVQNADETLSYSSVVVNTITIGEKNTSNEYPITIQEVAEIPFGREGGSSSFNIVQINDFNAGSHNQQGFVMPTENMVLFTNGSDTSLIGYREVQNDVPFYICYRGETVVDSGQFKYEAIAYKITETTLGYNIERMDLSAVFGTNFEFLPDYSESDNGKVLSVVSGKAQWTSAIGVIELTKESGAITLTQLNEIKAYPQNFTFKYHGKILSFTKADSTSYQYCNNTTNSSDNNVGAVSTLLTITSSTGAYTITENVHNVVANPTQPANGGDLTNIQVGSKVYSIPSGGIPSLPADASTKNYVLNSVNGTLTWNNIGNGLKINEAESKLELDYRFVTLKFHNLTYTFNNSGNAFNTLCIDITTYSYVLDGVLNNASSILGIEVNRNNISSLFTQFDSSTFLQFIRGLITAITTLELTAYSNFHIYESTSEQQNIINNYNALLIENLDGFFFPVYTGPETIKNLWISGDLNKNENSTFTFRESWYGD